MYAPGAPVGVQGFQSTIVTQHPIQSTYLSAPCQHQTQTSYPNPSYPNNSYQHQAQTTYPNPSYPNASNQHQAQTSYPNPSYPNASNRHPVYPSTANQHQIYGSYPSTPFRGYVHNAYGPHGNPSQYNPNPSNTDLHQRVEEAPMAGATLYQTPGPAGDYGGSGYGPAAPVHAQTQLSQAVHQQVTYHDSVSSSSSGNYGPYGQDCLGKCSAHVSVSVVLHSILFLRIYYIQFDMED